MGERERVVRERGRGREIVVRERGRGRETAVRERGRERETVVSERGGFLGALPLKDVDVAPPPAPYIGLNILSCFGTNSAPLLSLALSQGRLS